GKMEATKQGKIVSAFAPFGYRFEHYGKKASEKRLVVNDAQAEVVRMIFTLIAEGKFSTRGLALYLTETLKIPGPAGGRWYAARINKIVRDRLYLGEWAWRLTRQVEADPRRKRNPDTRRKSNRPRPQEERILISVPALIEEDLWERA